MLPNSSLRLTLPYKSLLSLFRLSLRYVEYAEYINLFKAEKCAGGGGDLLIYGFANKQLNGLLETYRALVKTVRSQFEVLTRISELRFQQVFSSEIFLTRVAGREEYGRARKKHFCSSLSTSSY